MKNKEAEIIRITENYEYAEEGSLEVEDINFNIKQKKEEVRTIV